MGQRGLTAYFYPSSSRGVAAEGADAGPPLFKHGLALRTRVWSMVEAVSCGTRVVVAVACAACAAVAASSAPARSKRVSLSRCSLSRVSLSRLGWGALRRHHLPTRRQPSASWRVWGRPAVRGPAGIGSVGDGPRLHYRLLTLCPVPTDPVPRGQL